MRYSSRWGILIGLVACFGMAGSASAFFTDIWPANADGSMNMHPSEGYAIAGDGNFRFTKTYQQMAFMGFAGKSDGPDGIPDGQFKGSTSDSNDGVLMADWLVGKKVFHAAVYLRNATAQTCDPYASAGDYLNDPVTIVGFRVANDGPFVDRGSLGHAFGGCCGSYNNPLLEGGENAPPAWRMGAPYVNYGGILGYSQPGDINEADPQHRWYKFSAADSLHPEEEVRVGSGGFGTTGFGGLSTNSGLAGSGHWAFDYLVQRSDAMMINSRPLNEADCTGFMGEEEPRDFAGDLNFGEGWFAEKVDRRIIQALVIPDHTNGIVECKGLVFCSLGVNLYLNTAVFSRDQGGGLYGPYLQITATYPGDVNNDGCVDVIDLLLMVPSWGLSAGDPGFDPESDIDCDGAVNVIDLLDIVSYWDQCVP